MIDLNKYREEKTPHKVSEVICVKCFHRWVAIRPVGTLLKDLHCEGCGAGFVIETGETEGFND